MDCQNKEQGMAGRKSTRLLLIVVVGLFFFSELLNAQTEPGLQHSTNLQTDSDITNSDNPVHYLSDCLDPSKCSDIETVNCDQLYVLFPGSASGNVISELSGENANVTIEQGISRLQLDYSLQISYSHRVLRDSFLQSSEIFIRSENDDQFLYSIDFKPSLIISDRIALNVIYSYIPEQDNFSGSDVMDFEVQQTVVDNVNRFSGNALSLSGSYAVPMNEWIQVSMELGFTHMRLNTEEVVRYHPSDPYLRSFRVVRLLVSKKRATYTNPFIGLGTEFQLRNLRLNFGYQHHVYQLDQASSSNFTISLGTRFSDLF